MRVLIHDETNNVYLVNTDLFLKNSIIHKNDIIRAILFPTLRTDRHRVEEFEPHIAKLHPLYIVAYLKNIVKGAWPSDSPYKKMVDESIKSDPRAHAQFKLFCTS